MEANVVSALCGVGQELVKLVGQGYGLFECGVYASWKAVGFVGAHSSTWYFYVIYKLWNVLGKV